MKLDTRLRQSMLDFNGKGLADHLLGVSIQNRMSGTLLQRQVEQMHRRPPLLDREAKDHLAFPTVQLCLKRVAFPLVHVGPQRLSEPSIVRPSFWFCSNGHLLHGALLNRRRVSSYHGLLHLLYGLHRGV